MREVEKTAASWKACLRYRDGVKALQRACQNGSLNGTSPPTEQPVQRICLPVPHRQYVWTIPKRLRIFFRERRLLGELARLAWDSIREASGDRLGRSDVLPGMIAGIQTFGELLKASTWCATADGILPARPPISKPPVRASYS